MAALVALAHPGHILLYAPGDSLAYRLATPRTALKNTGGFRLRKQVTKAAEKNRPGVRRARRAGTYS
ncbi:hypothetical protein CDU02_05670 [Cronobacter sakazakii]|nr:hypothetical protein CDU02_05670 [Cronobacter sakazakii]